MIIYSSLCKLMQQCDTLYTFQCSSSFTAMTPCACVVDSWILDFVFFVETSSLNHMYSLKSPQQESMCLQRYPLCKLWCCFSQTSHHNNVSCFFMTSCMTSHQVKKQNCPDNDDKDEVATLHSTHPRYWSALLQEEYADL